MIVRVVVPNIWPAVLSAAFLSVALVLGEYTIASLLNYDNLQVAIVLLGKSDAPDRRSRRRWPSLLFAFAAARAARPSPDAATARPSEDA